MSDYILYNNNNNNETNNNNKLTCHNGGMLSFRGAGRLQSTTGNGESRKQF